MMMSGEGSLNEFLILFYFFFAVYPNNVRLKLEGRFGQAFILEMLAL